MPLSIIKSSLAGLALYLILPSYSFAAATQAEYEVNLGRVYGFIKASTMFDLSCKNKLPEKTNYDPNTYQDWYEKNKDTITEINNHFTALIERISIEQKASPTDIQQEIDSMVDKTITPYLKTIETSDADTAQKICSAASASLKEPTSQIDTKYAEALKIIRNCHEDKNCEYLK